MKHTRFFLLAIAAIFLAACSEQNTPTFPSGGGGGENVTVGFTYTKRPPLTVAFTNTSKNAASYKWDFGDGESSKEKNPEHTYATKGSYRVTLTATSSDGIKYDAHATVEITEPKIYISGCALYAIPYENKYYKIVCKDDDLLTTNWGFETQYSPLIDNTDIPYVWNFGKRLLMDALSGDNYYTFYVYHATKTNVTSTDTQCLKQRLTKTEILKYKDEHVLVSDNGQTKLHILMAYE